MKTIKLFIAATLLLTINSYGQLDKGIWLVGGTGSFNSYKQYDSFILQGTGEYSKIRSNITAFELSPKVGLFIIDKLAVGLSSSFTSEKSESTTIRGNLGSGSQKVYRFSTGPFARYYFLNKDKNFNILAEANYQFGNVSWGDGTTKGTINKFSFLVGPEIFFNSSVGIEVLLGYKTYDRKMNNPYSISTIQNGFQVAIGFQIHLEKL